MVDEHDRYLLKIFYFMLVRDVFSSTNHVVQDCLCMIIYNCLNQQSR